MPQQVPLQTIPNQQFTITLDGNIFQLTFRSVDGVMACDMVINGTDTLDGIRCVGGSPVIPSRYQEAGNFMFITANEALPAYTEFGTTQVLLYFTAAELAAFRQPPPAILTAVNFNPLGALPLRFAPQNYKVQ